jgi:hypothetical protein
VRDLPRPERLSYEESCKRAADGVRRYWEAERPVREAKRQAHRASAAAEIGLLTPREIVIAGAIAYWCEGAKNKAYKRHDRVIFVNSDPALIRFFLSFLDAVGVSRDRLIFRVYIHETADVASAERFWRQLARASQEQFRTAVLKTHNPKTVRSNVGEDYRGCLRIDVRRSTDLYRKIEGWAAAVMTDPPRPVNPMALPPGVEPGS